MMRKLVSALCAAGLHFGIVASVQAEGPDPAGLCEIVSGGCYLDGLHAPPHRSIDDMGGFEVPLVASWRPLELNEGSQYRGDAKFGVYNFKIGEGESIKSYFVDIDLHQDDPGLSEEKRHSLFVYKCDVASGMCIATLVSAKAAITEQIARDYNTAVDNVRYESDANADFLGVFVNGMNPKKPDQRRQIYINTEVCGTYELTVALAGTIQ